MTTSLTTGVALPAYGGFDAALAGYRSELELADGRRVPLSTRRWHRPADRHDDWLLRRCCGPTIDLGCGPGRLVAALAKRGVRALGVDTSALAVRLCQARGGIAVRCDALAPLPHEGRWRHVLLADGNIGIGGDPLALLRRVGALVAAGGTVLIETAPPRVGLWRGLGRLCTVTGVGPWFPWAIAGLDTIALLGRSVGLSLVAAHHSADRFFAELASTAAPINLANTTPVVVPGDAA